MANVHGAAWEQEVAETPFSSGMEMEQASTAPVMLNSNSLSTFQNIIISVFIPTFKRLWRGFFKDGEDTQSYFDSIYKILAR